MGGRNIPILISCLGTFKANLIDKFLYKSGNWNYIGFWWGCFQWCVEQSCA